jgi:hypothetical protein
MKELLDQIEKLRHLSGKTPAPSSTRAIRAPDSAHAANNKAE